MIFDELKQALTWLNTVPPIIRKFIFGRTQATLSEHAFQGPHLVQESCSTTSNLGRSCRIRATILNLRPHFAVRLLGDRLILWRILFVDTSWEALYHSMWVCTYKVDDRVTLPGHPLFALDSVCKGWQRHTVECRLEGIYKDISRSHVTATSRITHRCSSASTDRRHSSHKRHPSVLLARTCQLGVDPQFPVRHSRPGRAE